MRTGLRIHVLAGQTVDGRTEYEFPAAASRPEERIVIGRDPDHCVIAFVDELRHTGLGNEHVALRRSLGRYQLDLNTQNAVLLNGRKTFEEKELTGTNVLQLGDLVKLEVTVVDDRSATLNDTTIRQPHEVTLGNRRLLAALTAAVAVLAIGGWWYVRWTDRQKQLIMTAAVAALADAQPVSDAVISRVRESIYAVILRNPEGGESIIGTAWSADGGKVVTNVHVVDVEHDQKLAAALDNGFTLLVRSAVPPHRSHRVVRRTLHPGNQRFLAVMAGMRPLRKGVGGFEQLGYDSACDVALLDVEDATDLAQPLEIASAGELRNLRAGQPIAMVGYPSEDMITEDVAQPEPVSQKASIVRMTDFFMDHRDDGNNLLVQHSLPLAGGASGSPIVNGAGRVVAVVTAVNVVGIPTARKADDDDDEQGNAREQRRIMNPAAVNFGQRADFVIDLLEGRQDEATSAYEADWLKSLARLDRVSEQTIPLRERQLSELFGRRVAPRVIREFTGKAGSPDGTDDVGDLPSEWLEVPRGLISVVAVPTASTDIDVALVDGSRVITETVDQDLAYHGDILLANRFARKLKFVAWAAAPPDRPVEPVEYRATVVDWGVNPDEYVGRVAWQELLDAIKEPAARRAAGRPNHEVELPPVRLDEPLNLKQGSVVATKVSWSLPRPGLCAITCLPSRPAELILLAAGSDGPRQVSTRSETPHAFLACQAADEPTTLLILAPGVNPSAEPLTVEVHVDAWLADGDE